MKFLKTMLLLAAIFGFAPNAFADQAKKAPGKDKKAAKPAAKKPAAKKPAKKASVEPIVGVWKTIDDKTKKANSHLRLWIKDGVLYGKIIKLLREKDPNPLCKKCKGKRKNKPVIGMMNVWGLKKQKNGDWAGGKILDPKNGKVYNCKMWTNKAGKVLNVRGYVWIFFRTQKWYKIR